MPLEIPEVITLPVDFRVLTLVSILFFMILGVLGGWKRAIVTLVGLFFAWGVAVKASAFLIRAVRILLGLDFSGPLAEFFSLSLFVGSTVMVVVTFYKIIENTANERRDKLIGSSFGLLSGYFFMVLLLDVSREWIQLNLNNWTLRINLGVSLNTTPGELTLIVRFVNDATQVYEELISVQSLVLLALLVIFWHGFIFSLVGQLDRILRSA
ncbi:MAG: hypothetical protein Q9O62_00405 [Ardenticatenia bacterium]|nr:hypothetical protein [Ardenticatenia bacterium]